MLNSSPPPGYNASAINQQQVGINSSPGPQGNVAQGYLSNPYRSSYAAPSSYAVPSSTNAPNPYYAPQPQAGNQAQMVAALAGRR